MDSNGPDRDQKLTKNGLELTKNWLKMNQEKSTRNRLKVVLKVGKKKSFIRFCKMIISNFSMP